MGGLPRENGDVYGARVSTGGGVLDSEGIVISAAALRQGVPSVSSDGANSLVVWQDEWSGTSADVYGARVSSAGAVLDPLGIPISTAHYLEGSPSAAFDGTNYLVVWEDSPSETAIYGARVSPEGTVLDPTAIVISAHSNDLAAPTVAFDGTNYLVAWQAKHFPRNSTSTARSP